MDILEQYFNETVKFKNQHHYQDNILKEFVFLTASALYEHYMFLIPSTTNKTFIQNVQKVFNYVKVIEKNNEKRDQHARLYDIMLHEVTNKNPRYKSFLKALQDNVIILEKDDNINDFLESMKIISKLSGTRSKNPLQISVGFINYNNTINKLVGYLNRKNEFQNFNAINHICSPNKFIEMSITFSFQITQDQIANKDNNHIKEIKQNMVQKMKNLVQADEFLNCLELKYEPGFEIYCKQSSLNYSERRRWLKSNVLVFNSTIKSNNVMNIHQKFICKSYTQIRNFILQSIKNT